MKIRILITAGIMALTSCNPAKVITINSEPIHSEKVVLLESDNADFYCDYDDFSNNIIYTDSIFNMEKTFELADIMNSLYSHDTINVLKQIPNEYSDLIKFNFINLTYKNKVNVYHSNTLSPINKVSTYTKKESNNRSNHKSTYLINVENKDILLISNHSFDVNDK